MQRVRRAKKIHQFWPKRCIGSHADGLFTDVESVTPVEKRRVWWPRHRSKKLDLPGAVRSVPVRNIAPETLASSYQSHVKAQIAREINSTNTPSMP